MKRKIMYRVIHGFVFFKGLLLFLKNIIVKKTCVLPTFDPKDCASFFRWAADLKRPPTDQNLTSSNDGQSVSPLPLPPSSDEPSPTLLDEIGEDRRRLY